MDIAQPNPVCISVHPSLGRNRRQDDGGGRGGGFGGNARNIGTMDSYENGVRGTERKGDKEEEEERRRREEEEEKNENEKRRGKRGRGGEGFRRSTVIFHTD